MNRQTISSVLALEEVQGALAAAVLAFLMEMCSKYTLVEVGEGEADSQALIVRDVLVQEEAAAQVIKEVQVAVQATAAAEAVAEALPY